MTDILGIQIGVFILLTLVAGIIIGSAVTANIYRHRIALKEAEETGRKKERLRLPPPTPYEQMLNHLNALANDDRVTGFTVHAYGETFDCWAANDETE